MTSTITPNDSELELTVEDSPGAGQVGVWQLCVVAVLS